MSWIEALILGIVQGLTEFLPVSSSGHLQIGAALLGAETPDSLIFTVAVHTATVLATIVALRREIAGLLAGLLKFRRNDETLYIAKLAVSAIPVGIVGVFLEDRVEEVFSGGQMIVGLMLLVTAALLAFAYYARPRQKEKISFRDALVIGIAQACAVLPGLSRSGATISAGILSGNRKESVAKFSFLMVLAPIIGKSLIDLTKGEFTAAASGIPAASLLAGFAAAFVAGYIACSWMINLVKRGKLVYFAVYCTVVGVATIIWQSLM